MEQLLYFPVGMIAQIVLTSSVTLHKVYEQDVVVDYLELKVGIVHEVRILCTSVTENKNLLQNQLGLGILGTL